MWADRFALRFTPAGGRVILRKVPNIMETATPASTVTYGVGAALTESDQIERLVADAICVCSTIRSLDVSSQCRNRKKLAFLISQTEQLEGIRGRCTEDSK